MTNRKKFTDPKIVQQTKTWYKFLLKGDTEFQGQFKQISIKVNPTFLNGKPIELAIAMITKIQRVNDPGWLVSQKLMYFIFELNNGTKIVGLPACNVLSVRVPFIDPCNVEFKNILQVEKVM